LLSRNRDFTKKVSLFNLTNDLDPIRKYDKNPNRLGVYTKF